MRYIAVICPKLVGDVNISMNIQYVAIISETPDVPHIGPPFDGGSEKSSPTECHAWPSARGDPMGPTWAKLRETLFRQPSDPDSLRGHSVQEQPSDSETDFPTYKTHTGGRSWDQSQTGGDERAQRIFCQRISRIRSPASISIPALSSRS